MKSFASTPSSKRVPFTEEVMADEFERLLSMGYSLPGIGRLTRVFREIDCHRGRPDFVALAHGTTRFFRGKSVSAKSAGSLVLSFLHDRAPRSAEYLAKHSGMSMRTVRSVTSELVTRKYALETETGTFVSNPERSLWKIQVWAFELKIDKPKRAVFQAQHYRSFANRVLIVVPPGQVHLYDKYRLSMHRWGIGLASFDPIVDEFEIHRAARPDSAHSRRHQAYALFQLLGA